jgi:hypothetical protein
MSTGLLLSAGQLAVHTNVILVQEELVKVKRLLIGFIGSTLISMMAAPAASAAASVTFKVDGVVQCASGRAAEGVWVASSAGGSNWASWKALPGNAAIAYYSFALTTPVDTSISLHVGCAIAQGTSSTWASDNYTPNYNNTSNSTAPLVINALNCSSGTTLVAKKTVTGACTLPTQGVGTSSATNPGDHGYCTCGASYFWKNNTGSYPSWTGDADVWVKGAQSKKWTVVSFPAPHALIVWTGQDHVGWVTSVNWSAQTLTYIDMNGGNIWVNEAQEKTNLFNEFDQKTCSLSTNSCTSARIPGFHPSLSGAQYILAQPSREWSWGSGSYPATAPNCPLDD